MKTSIDTDIRRGAQYLIVVSGLSLTRVEESLGCRISLPRDSSIDIAGRQASHLCWCPKERSTSKGLQKRTPPSTAATGQSKTLGVACCHMVATRSFSELCPLLKIYAIPAAEVQGNQLSLATWTISGVGGANSTGSGSMGRPIEETDAPPLSPPLI